MKKLLILCITLLGSIPGAMIGDIILRFEGRNDAEKKILEEWLYFRRSSYNRDETIQFISNRKAGIPYEPAVDAMGACQADSIRLLLGDDTFGAMTIGTDIMLPNPTQEWGEIQTIILHGRGVIAYFRVKDNHKYIIRHTPCSDVESSAPLFQNALMQEKSRAFFCVQEGSIGKEELEGYKKAREELDILHPVYNDIFGELLIGPKPGKASSQGDEITK